MNIVMKFLIVVIIVAIILYGKSRYYLNVTFNRIDRTGTVVILNGPSAAGKSSIQKQLQHAMMPNLWIKVGVDNLFDLLMPDIMPENLSVCQSENSIRWVTASKDKDNNPIITLHVGPQGDNVAYGMNSAIAAYAANGCNVVVDYIAYKKEWIDDLQNKLKHIKTVWVKVSAPLSTLEERESARATSPKGHARSHYDTVYWDVKYDLEVNSQNNSAQEISEQIKNILKK